MSGLGEARVWEGGMTMDGEKSLSDPAKWSMSKVRRAVCKSAETRRGEESSVQRGERWENSITVREYFTDARPILITQ